jgi:NADPH:quinone reductase
VFTLLTLLTGEGLGHHGEILANATSLAEEDKLKPLLNPNHFSTSEIDAAYAVVESGSLGKVVIDTRSS